MWNGSHINLRRFFQLVKFWVSLRLISENNCPGRCEFSFTHEREYGREKIRDGIWKIDGGRKMRIMTGK